MDASAAELRLRRAVAYETPRPEVQELVPRDARRILDVGCCSGALGEALKERQNAEVVGIELDPGYATDAARRLDRVLELDAGLVVPEDHGLAGFDCLIAADVLEHLADPWRTLRTLTRALAPGGTAVISLPNARYWETFWALGVRGTWPLRDKGIFDDGHLRWFARRDALALMRQAGLHPVTVSPRYRLRPSDWRTERHGRWFARTPLAPFFVFQYVLLGVKTGP